MELVCTKRRTPFCRAARSTFFVPPTLIASIVLATERRAWVSASITAAVWNTVSTSFEAASTSE